MADHSVHPTNRLAHETSPYLLQHAHNPVDWHPWGEEVLALARRQKKPILLSIGYSACHWCHVMAHESFENEETAALMNELFINIKVDREERPDLDKIYQSAHQLLVGRGGGWPLTMFLTPEQTPFFGGTYFPPEPRHGLPDFRTVLQRVEKFYREHPERVAEQNEALLGALANTLAEPGEQVGQLTDAPIRAAREQLAANFDDANGGFGGAPKFPHAPALEFLLRRGTCGDTQAREMAVRSLRAMADGGIYDHVGGGFFRYAVDERWEIPHFEKMLYDNGPLIALYAEAWELTGEPQFREVAESVGEWVMREMTSPEGGYYATLDADSAGGEGGYYLWGAEEAEELLGHAEFQVAALRFGLDQHPNFEGRWHLHATCPLNGIAAAVGLSETEVSGRLASAGAKLFAARSRRDAPGRDEKVLTAWNALMIRGMARAGRVLGRDDFVASAGRALDFIRRHLWHDGRLLAAHKDGQAHLPAYLDDHAFLVDAVLELLQARWRDGEISFATQLADLLLDHFEDETAGGFFFTADDHEKLIHRPKPLADESLPAGNAVAARSLSRLGHLLGDLHYTDAAEHTLRAAWGELNDAPYAHASLLTALDEVLTPPALVVLRGEEHALASWSARCTEQGRPTRQVFAVPDSATDLPKGLEQRKSIGPAVAYVCAGRQCSPPITEFDALESALGVD